MKKILLLLVILVGLRTEKSIAQQLSKETIDFANDLMNRPAGLSEERAYFLMTHPMQKDTIIKNQKIKLDKIIIPFVIDGFISEYDALPAYYHDGWHTEEEIHQKVSTNAQITIYKGLWSSFFVVILLFLIVYPLVDVYQFLRMSKKSENKEYLHERYMKLHKSMVLPNFQRLLFPLPMYALLVILLPIEKEAYVIFSALLWIIITAIVSGIFRRIFTYFFIIKRHIAFA